MFKVKEFKNRLTKINNTEPLNPLSIILIICLDVFILVNIFTGIGNQSQQLVSPIEYIPQITRNIIINENWVEGNRISKLSSIVLHEYRSFYYKDNINNEINPKIKNIMETLEKIKTNDILIKYFRDRDKLYRNYNTYDDRLTNINALKVLEQIENIDFEINRNEDIIVFWNIIENSSQLSQDLTDELRKLNFIYPIKKILFEFLFLVPLLVVFIFWNLKSIKKSNNLQVLISTHLVVVSMIPILFKVISLILDIIPNKILKEFIGFLESINLIAIWHYIIILLAIIITFSLIYIVQNKVFNKERLRKRRLIKNQCIGCGKKILSNIKYCPACGENQKEDCKSCSKETFAVGGFCIHCGVKKLN